MGFISKVRHALFLHRVRNEFLLSYRKWPVTPERVNVNWWKMRPQERGYNLGDMLSPVIVDYMLRERGLTLDTPVSGVRHLYAVGSILLWGGANQDAVIWGTGLIGSQFLQPKQRFYNILFHHLMHRIDVRAVRGPNTRKALRYIGVKCPEVYGDPALLLPRFFPVEAQARREYNIIPHHSNYEEFRDDPHFVDIVTEDWQHTVREICSAKLNISGSLHGIILSEAYGIPAVFLSIPNPKTQKQPTLFKYNDYYQSTGRDSFPIATSVEEALRMSPPPLPDISSIQERLAAAFPYDLWEK